MLPLKQSQEDNRSQCGLFLFPYCLHKWDWWWNKKKVTAIYTHSGTALACTF